ncbi:hypothetical protein FHS86_003232 [Roseimarinus sediminis]
MQEKRKENRHISLPLNTCIKANYLFKLITKL